MEFDISLLTETRDMYNLVNQLFLICIRKGLRIIFENPYSEEHFLRRYWCLSPKIIDTDRTARGDYFNKPTQYWFMNCDPSNNCIFEVVPNNFIGVKDAIKKASLKDWDGEMNSCKTIRSMIHPDYANRFIREFIL